MYKHLILLTYVLNVLMLMMGGVALYQYLQSESLTALQVVIVAGGVLVFGVLLPAWIVSQLMRQMEELRRQTERVVAEYISKWLESFEEFKDDEPLQNPKFWLNMGLLMFEVMSEHSQHPAVQALAEFTPILRREIKSAGSSRRKSRKSEE